MTPRWSQAVTQTRLAVTLWFSAVAVASGAIVLWVRQSPDALLRADSFWGALIRVAIWALPTLLLYVALARRPTLVLVEGVFIVVIISASWWTAATDSHSTASWGPGSVGWVIGPAVIFLVFLVPLLVAGAGWSRKRDDAEPQRT